MKEAVVYIVDASPSMNAPYPRDFNEKSKYKVKTEDGAGTEPSSSSSSSLHANTRLGCAKKRVQSMIADLMIQSKTNEVCVILLKTPGTSHHKIASSMDLEEEDPDSIPFPNLTELTNGVTRPSIDLLRKLQQVETCTTQEVLNLKGDFCDGIILAADALYERTYKKKYQRKIVLITDAEHDIVMDVNQILVVVDSLRSMDCRLEVIGMDFGSSAKYDEPAPAPVPSHGIKQEDQGEDDIQPNDDAVASDEETDVGSDQEDEDEDDDENGVNRVVYSVKEDREKLLVSLTEKTGGKVTAASTLQHLFEADGEKKIQMASKGKIELRIAPGLKVEAKKMILLKKENFPSLKTVAAMLDGTENRTVNANFAGAPLPDEKVASHDGILENANNIVVLDALGQETTLSTKQKVFAVNSLGQEMTVSTKQITSFVDEDEADRLVSDADRTTAVTYGASLIPMNAFDYEGLKKAADLPHIEILGYLGREEIPPGCIIGPPTAVSGHDSQQACALISGLAQALQRLNKVAICTYLKSKTSSGPVLGGLFALPEPDCLQPIHLVFLQLPFAGDVKQLEMRSFDEFFTDAETTSKSKACDAVIDALMLPDGVLESGKIPSPFLRSWKETVIKRALNPKAEVVAVRTFDKHDPMVTPPDVLERALPALDSFHESFPLVRKKEQGAEKKKGQKRKRALTYKDYLDE
jgi:ATP-dependent DNA helicase 2 subunit 2